MKRRIAAAAALAVLVASAWAHDEHAKKAKPAADKAAAAQKKDDKAKPAAKQAAHDKDHQKGH